MTIVETPDSHTDADETIDTDNTVFVTLDEWIGDRPSDQLATDGGDRR